jgi:hypothetical protein
MPITSCGGSEKRSVIFQHPFISSVVVVHCSGLTTAFSLVFRELIAYELCVSHVTRVQSLLFAALPHLGMGRALFCVNVIQSYS